MTFRASLILDSEYCTLALILDIFHNNSQAYFRHGNYEIVNSAKLATQGNFYTNFAMAIDNNHISAIMNAVFSASR